MYQVNKLFIFSLLTISTASAMLPASKKQNTGTVATKALGTAIVDGDRGGITTAIEQGADVTSLYIKGENPPLPYISIALLELPDEKAVPVIKILLENGADVNQTGLVYGFSPLHWAAGNMTKYYPCCIPLLLQHGANLTIRDNNGNMPIHLAAKKIDTVFLKSLIDCVPAQQIIKIQRKRVFSLLCCFKRFKTGDPFKIKIPKDIQRMLCHYAINADVGALVNARIAWLQEHFMQKANDKTVVQISRKARHDIYFEAFSAGRFFMNRLINDQLSEFEKLIELRNINQRRPTIRKNIEKALQDTPLWGNAWSKA